MGQVFSQRGDNSCCGRKCCGLQDDDFPLDTLRGRPMLQPLKAPYGGLVVTSWNVAARNNNPFEYWITHDTDSSRYVKLMEGVEKFIEEPGDKDIPMSDVFTEDMFRELKGFMTNESWQGVDEVEKMWHNDYSKRNIISGFMKDNFIGSKRLASMPDSLTNTIHCASGAPNGYRPTVINNYAGHLGSVEEWWPKWIKFMFKEKHFSEQSGEFTRRRPCELLSKISKSKYPAITEEEEKVSIALQCLCQGIFDAILVHIMTTLSPHWQEIIASIVEAIHAKKDQQTMKILTKACLGSDVICLQECASSLKKMVEKELGDDYYVVAPRDADSNRDRNSMILLSRTQFMPGCEELTQEVMITLGADSPVDKGDLLVVVCRTDALNHYMISSFHGDTNGLSTKPVITAINKVMKEHDLAHGLKHRMVVGLDANTYLKPSKGSLDVADFSNHIKSLGLTTCWPDDTKWEDCSTCFNARTYLQPQLNKAVKSAQRFTEGDVNPKDHIVFQVAEFQVTHCYKDNTGQRRYSEKTCFPTFDFPSDHGVVCAILKPVESKMNDDMEDEEENDVSIILGKKEEKRRREEAPAQGFPKSLSPMNTARSPRKIDKMADSKVRSEEFQDHGFQVDSPIAGLDNATLTPSIVPPTEEAAPAPEPVKPAEEAAPAAEPEKPAESAPAPEPVNPAEEAAPAAEPEKPAEAAPAPEPEKPAEEAAPAAEPEKPAEAAPAPEPEKPAEEAAPAPAPVKPAEEATPKPEKNKPSTDWTAPKEAVLLKVPEAPSSNGSKKKKGKK